MRTHKVQFDQLIGVWRVRVRVRVQVQEKKVWCATEVPGAFAITATAVLCDLFSADIVSCSEAMCGVVMSAWCKNGGCRFGWE